MDRQCQSITREGRTGIGSIAKTVWALSWLCCYVGETLLVTSGHKPIQAARGKEQLTASFSEQNNPTNKARPRAGSREAGSRKRLNPLTSIRILPINPYLPNQKPFLPNRHLQKSPRIRQQFVTRQWRSSEFSSRHRPCPPKALHQPCLKRWRRITKPCIQQQRSRLPSSLPASELRTALPASGDLLPALGHGQHKLNLGRLPINCRMK